MRDPTSHAFFDANVYLGLYGLPPPDLDQIRKLVDVLEAGHLVVYLPSQVESEFRRRRAGVIADFLKPLREARPSVVPPAMARGNPESAEVVRLVAEAEKTRAKLLRTVTNAAKGKILAADELLGRLFGQAKQVACEAYLELASTRRALGHPPGKKSSLGDAVNWEALLGSVENGKDLCLVSSDADFGSPLNRDELDEYLAEEWVKQKGSRITFYRDFPTFLGAEYPRLHLATDVWKHLLIEALGRTETFDETHDIVRRLASHREFTAAEAEHLLLVALHNPQVRWIALDSDVQDLVRRVLSVHERDLAPTLCARWRIVLEGRLGAYGPVPTDEDVAEADS